MDFSLFYGSKDTFSLIVKNAAGSLRNVKVKAIVLNKLKNYRTNRYQQSNSFESIYQLKYIDSLKILY